MALHLFLNIKIDQDKKWQKKIKNNILSREFNNNIGFCMIINLQSFHLHKCCTNCIPTFLLTRNKTFNLIAVYLHEGMISYKSRSVDKENNNVL